MASTEKITQSNENDPGLKTRPNAPDVYHGALQTEHLNFGDRLADITNRPHRHPLIHWSAFAFSLISLIPPIFWVLTPSQSLSVFWLYIDIGFAVFFGMEFLTRSGLRWDPASYVRSRFFDFVAIVPAMVLVYYNVPYLQIWVWMILLARGGRVIDRVLGDGFWARNVFAIAEGFEEEITDRVLSRIMARVQADLSRGKFGQHIGEALDRNKETVLERIRAHHPNEGIKGGLAKMSGLNSALERAEERAFDSVVEIVKSPEVDRAIRDAVDSAFLAMKHEMKSKSWRKQLGIRREPDDDGDTAEKPDNP